MKTQNGFTLMELMVIIAIIGILSTIAIPNAIAWRNNARFNASVREVKRQVEAMRMFAIKSNMRAAVEFTDGTNSFVTRTWTRGVPGGTPKTYLLPSDITLSSNFGGDQLLFNNRGMSNLGTITIQNTGGLSRTIIVNIVGTSRISG